MSEYQRYEFMTSDRPLTRAQLNEVNELSRHIEATPTQAIIEYRHGDFKHDPIRVLQDFFDGLLYWTNWKTPQLAFRFPHGILPADLIDDYDFSELVSFTRHSQHDILNIDNNFDGMEGSGDQVETELDALMPLRDELMRGDRRPLYLAWLAQKVMMEGEEEYGDDEDDKGTNPPPVPPGLDKLTKAQQALVELWYVPSELIATAARHNKAAAPAAIDDDFVAWIELLPHDRRSDYLLRLTQNEDGLNHLLIDELRRSHSGKATMKQSVGERVPYATLLAERESTVARQEREKSEPAQQAHLRHLQEIHDHQGEYWRQVELAATRETDAGYDEATRLLIELRETAEQFQELQAFQEIFSSWIRSQLSRPPFLKRLKKHSFGVPEAQSPST
jgi:hypothetical protein